MADRSRIIRTAEYISETGATVRQAAAVFGISKSTVHKDVTERLEHIDPDLFDGVKRILAANKAERHLRGGEATKMKYVAIKLKRKRSEDSDRAPSEQIKREP